MSNTAEIREKDDGYMVTCQNTDGEVFVNSIVIEEDAFENIDSATQEDGRTAYEAKDGHEFILDGEQLVGTRIGYLNCVEESDVETYVVPYGDGRYTFEEMVDELGVPDTDDALEKMGFLPFVDLEVEYDTTTKARDVTGVKIEGKWYDIEPRGE